MCLGSIFVPFLDIDAVWAFLILNFECQLSEILFFIYIVGVLPITVLTSDRVLDFNQFAFILLSFFFYQLHI